jgi:hypothetical protein
MKKRISPILFLLGVLTLSLEIHPVTPEKISIICPKNPSFLETLASREVFRYVYLRTGALLPIVNEDSLTFGESSGIVIAGKDRELMRGLVDAKDLEPLGPQQFLLKTRPIGTRQLVLITGGDALGTLYGAYRLAEYLGVRFYLHGDMIPDEKVPLQLPGLNEKGKPLFSLRGIQPFHDFPEGPDWWNLDDYKAILSQLPKLRMNFIGLHTYPEGGPNAEPTTWIGLPGDFDGHGSVSFSYPASYQNTLRGNWGYRARKTGEFWFGGADLFNRDAYGADVMQDFLPSPESVADSNQVFDRTGSMLREAFSWARQLGIQTCIGTETPLTVPSILKERLKKMGKNPADPMVVEELYEGMFNRIVQTHGLDYYWLWTPEDWTWKGVSGREVEAVTTDMQAALTALQKVRAPFRMATCGWVLGPQNDRALFDKFLPKDVPVSCINREVGHAPIDPSFSKITGRSKWAIPWLEDDPALTSIQLWVGRMRRDAADALRYGCEGLIGIHWRTRVLGPAVSALAQASWDQTAWIHTLPQSKPRPSVAGPIGGKHVTYSASSFQGVDDAPLYHGMRVDVSGYRLGVPNGRYKVILKFAESQFDSPGRRTFGVEIQGQRVLDRLDIFARAGQNKPFIYETPDVTVTDRWLDIEFIPEIDVPSIAAIAIEGSGYSQKINCGGPAYQDYVADLPSSKPVFPPVADFYQDWAGIQFGGPAGPQAARIFERIDGDLPRPSDWVDGPGNLKPDLRPWDEVRKEYDFVEELAALRPTVEGLGNLERFDYWLDSFRYLKGMARVNCLWAEFNTAMEKARSEKAPAILKERTRELALPARIRLVQAVREVYGYLLALVSNSGEMGTVANWEQHIFPELLIKPGQELEKFFGEPLPKDAWPTSRYEGPTRIFVPTIRTAITAEEALALKVIVLSQKPPSQINLYWRTVGDQGFSRVPVGHIARGIYSALVPPVASSIKAIEYYVEAVPQQGKPVLFPVTAPEICQTVVIVPGERHQ